MVTGLKSRVVLILAGIVLLYTSALAAPRKVTVTFLPVYIFAKNVAGEKAELRLLIPPGTDVHEFSLRPLDLKALGEADIVFISGAGLENHIIKKIDRKKVVDISKGIKPVKGDPHIWLDPVLAIAQVKNIRYALQSLDPENRQHYQSNADAYISRLKALHREIRQGLLKLRGRRLITYHESFNYFARRYGLVPYSLTGPDAESPLPGRMRAVYDIVRAEGVRAVFAEQRLPRKALERLKRDLGVWLCTLNSLETGKPSPDYYEKAMRENLKSIIRCLGNR